MKKTHILLLALLLGSFARPGRAAIPISVDLHVGSSGHATVDIGFFYDDLAPYGRWVQRPQYGWVWTPRAVARTWRPYQAGHWAWTDYGWTWISDEPYGWATYHYGRWYDDPEYGWEWIPGEQWAPAWVSWQEGGDYIGWAPLPPSYDFRPGTVSVQLGAAAFVFVPENRFLAPRIVDYVVSPARVTGFFPRTRNITQYDLVGQRIFNRGVAVERIQQVTGRPVTRYQVAELSAGQRHRGARIGKNRVEMFRPQIRKAKVVPPPERAGGKHAVANAPRAQAPVTRQPMLKPAHGKQAAPPAKLHRQDRPAPPRPGQAPKASHPGKRGPQGRSAGEHQATEPQGPRVRQQRPPKPDRQTASGRGGRPQAAAHGKGGRPHGGGKQH